MDDDADVDVDTVLDCCPNRLLLLLLFPNPPLVVTVLELPNVVVLLFVPILVPVLVPNGNGNDAFILFEF